MKLESFRMAKDTSFGQNDSLQNKKKIFINYTSDTGLIRKGQYLQYIKN